MLQVLLSLRDTYSVLDWKQGAELPTYNRSVRVLSTEKSDVINYILVLHYPINMQGNC